MDKYFKYKYMFSCDEQNTDEMNIRDKSDKNNVDVDPGEVGVVGGVGMLMLQIFSPILD